MHRAHYLFVTLSRIAIASSLTATLTLYEQINWRYKDVTPEYRTPDNCAISLLQVAKSC